MPWATTTGTTRTGTAAWKHLRERMKHELDYQCADEHHGPCAGNLELDHIHPVKEGGTDNPDNLQWLCKRHNMIKAQHEAQRARRRRANRGVFETEAHPGVIN